MPERPKILLLDDDQQLLELYREMLSKLPSQPEVRLATSGARAIALLESEPFALLVSDLNMPKMDGLQVLTIVRRKFPHLRTAVMTAMVDTQFRARSYAMGIDLFLEKPNTPQEVSLFMDCIESLLGREVDGGFRGVQSKSLMDIIQLECLSHSSAVLKITNGPLMGRIWFQDGEIIDAEAPELKGEAAFQKILSWKTGAFEIMPAEPNHPRVIQTSAHGLLLESAQAIDEATAISAKVTEGKPAEQAEQAESPLAAFKKFEGVEFVMELGAEGKPPESWGVEDAERLAGWIRQALQRFGTLAESLHAGDLKQFEAVTQQAHMVMVPRGKDALCCGFRKTLTPDQVRATAQKMVALWLS
jgi:CheY-like chemotaxis protein